MKKQIILIAIILMAGFGYTAHAQVTVGVNIGLQPLWGPVGYDQASYYYLPDIDVYYDVVHAQYVYFEGGRWITRHSLPPRYAGYDLYHGYKAVINEPSPWLHADRYRTQYASYRGRHDQQVIRDSHEDRYRANPHHPEHAQWHGGHEQPHHDEGHHEEHHEGHGR
jgi:hypothetical protein